MKTKGQNATDNVINLADVRVVHEAVENMRTLHADVTEAFNRLTCANLVGLNARLRTKAIKNAIHLKRTMLLTSAEAVAEGRAFLQQNPDASPEEYNAHLDDWLTPQLRISLN